MSKNLFKTVSNSHIVALSELTDDELLELIPFLPEDEPETDASLLEDDDLPSLPQVTEQESELFCKIVTALSKSMPYGQAVLLTSIYAVTVEDRVHLTFA